METHPTCLTLLWIALIDPLVCTVIARVPVHLHSICLVTPAPHRGYGGFAGRLVPERLNTALESSLETIPRVHTDYGSTSPNRVEVPRRHFSSSAIKTTVGCMCNMIENKNVFII